MNKDMYISIGFQEDRTSFHVISFRSDLEEAKAIALTNSKTFNIQSYRIFKD